VKLGGVTAAMALVLVGLSGCDNNPPSSQEPGTPATTAVTYRETATCRHDAARLLDIAEANVSSNLGYDEFHRRFDQLSARQDDAMLACSRAVSAPFAMALYHYAVANAEWLACPGKNCDLDKITTEVSSGNNGMDKARAALGAKE
jgi:hypothetical protein